MFLSMQFTTRERNGAPTTRAIYVVPYAPFLMTNEHADYQVGGKSPGKRIGVTPHVCHTPSYIHLCNRKGSALDMGIFLGSFAAAVTPDPSVAFAAYDSSVAMRRSSLPLFADASVFRGFGHRSVLVAWFVQFTQSASSVMRRSHCRDAQRTHPSVRPHRHRWPHYPRLLYGGPPDATAPGTP